MACSMIVVGSPGAIIDTFQNLSRRMDDPQQPSVVPRERIGIRGSDMRVGSFLYPGGLAAVHARGRSREAIWEALSRRQVYGTSGPRAASRIERRGGRKSGTSSLISGHLGNNSVASFQSWHTSRCRSVGFLTNEL